jgi:hypothetical protein
MLFAIQFRVTGDPYRAPETEDARRRCSGAATHPVDKGVQVDTDRLERGGGDAEGDGEVERQRASLLGRAPSRDREQLLHVPAGDPPAVRIVHTTPGMGG